jgi:hypothetical protein
MQITNSKKTFNYLMLFFLIGNIAIGIIPGHGTWVYVNFTSNIIFFLLILSKIQLFSFTNIYFSKVLSLLFFYQIFILFHGFFIANDFSQWRYLIISYSPYILLCFFTVICTIDFAIFYFLKFVLIWILPSSFLFYLISLNLFENVSYINFLSPLYLFLFFFNYFQSKTKFLITIIVLFSVFTNFANRTHLLFIVLSIAFLVLQKTNSSFRLRKKLIKSFFILPLVFIFFNITIGFNIFTKLESLNPNEEIVLNSNDSRSGVYLDAFSSISNFKSFIFGNSPVAYYESYLAEADDVINGKYRLGASEVAFLNFIQFGGIIYFCIFTLLIIFIINRVIIHCNSILVLDLALFLSINWLFMFIEKPIEMNFYWITIFGLLGFLQNKSLLKMDNKQFLESFNSIIFN